MPEQELGVVNRVRKMGKARGLQYGCAGNRFSHWLRLAPSCCVWEDRAGHVSYPLAAGRTRGSVTCKQYTKAF